MRRGPQGPRSLCNACGLTWANRVRYINIMNIIFDQRTIFHIYVPIRSADRLFDAGNTARYLKV